MGSNAPELDPNVQAGQSLYEDGDYQGALAAFEKAQMSDNDADTLRGLAMSHHMLGHLDEATYNYIALLALDPDDATSQVNLGLVYHSQGRLMDAIDRFRRAAALEAEDPFHWVALGRALYDAAEFEESIEVMERALELRTDDSEAYTYLGLAHEALGAPTEARRNYEQAVALDAHDPFAHLHLAALLIDEGSAEEVIAHAHRALEEFEVREDEEFQARSLWLIGWGLYMDRQWEASITASRRSLDLEPSFPIVHMNLGLALLRAGHVDQAREAYVTAIDLVTETWDADEGLRDLNNAIADQDDLPGAEEMRELLEKKSELLRNQAAASVDRVK